MQSARFYDFKPKLRSAFNSVGYFCCTSPSWRAASALVTGDEAFSSNERSRSRRELNSDWSTRGLFPPTCFEIALPSLIYNSSLVVSFSQIFLKNGFFSSFFAKFSFQNDPIRDPRAVRDG